MAWLWPESNLKRARWSLNSAIYALRKLLRSQLSPPASSSDFVLFDKGHYRLDPTIEAWTDTDEFEARYEHAHHLERTRRKPEAVAEYEATIGLYRGDYLVEDLYEDWTMYQRRRVARDGLLVAGGDATKLPEATMRRFTRFRFLQNVFSEALLLDPFSWRPQGMTARIFCVGRPAGTSLVTVFGVVLTHLLFARSSAAHPDRRTRDNSLPWGEVYQLFIGDSLLPVTVTKERAQIRSKGRFQRKKEDG